MSRSNTLWAVSVCAVAVCGLVAGGHAQTQQKPTVAIPKPGVPQIMTMEGKFVRASYNNEGYAIMGYQIANESVGQEWMLLDLGMTLRENQKNQKFTRSQVSLETPDGKTIPLATNQEFSAANLRALQQRAQVMRDSINYFPPKASQPCRIGFYAEVASPTVAYDEVELGPTRACMGRIFFKVPGGIKYGQHWLNLKLAGGLLRVPFRILTADEEKMLSKNYKDIKKQVDDAFKPKGK